MGTADSVPGDFKGSILPGTLRVRIVQHRNYNCTTQILTRNSSENVGLHRGWHNIDYRSIPQFPSRVPCVQTRKSRKTLSFDKVSFERLRLSTVIISHLKQFWRKGRQNLVEISDALSYACTCAWPANQLLYQKERGLGYEMQIRACGTHMFALRTYF